MDVFFETDELLPPLSNIFMANVKLDFCDHPNLLSLSRSKANASSPPLSFHFYFRLSDRMASVY